MGRLACLAVILAVGVNGWSLSAAQAQQPSSLYDRYTQPIQIFKTGLGTFTKPMSSTNPEAQAFFDQGFQMMYAFAKPEAVRSFREAWTRDPACAICYWGEAWAWGSYLNSPMDAEEAPHAYAAVQQALSLKHRATGKERALIDAMAVRYVATFDAPRRVEQDRAYAEAMGKVSSQYPDDLEIATLYADALFLLEPRRGTRDVNDPNVHRLHEVLESVLARDVHHPGACHLYVHATESTVVPGRAQACAEFLGQSIPGASHINHMPSHTWNEVGRWGDSVRANLDAWHSDQKAAIGQGFAIYPEHNLHMLLYAASYDGQGAVAMRAGKDYTKLTGNSFYEALTLLRFGRFDDVLEVTNRPKGEIQGGLWDFAQGYAHLKRGNVDFATLYLARVTKAAANSTAMLRVHKAKDLLGVVTGILDGEIHRTSGDLDGAIAAFQRAADLQAALVYDEPEPLPFSAFHWLGAALLERGRFDDAEKAYRTELADHPHNGWSLLGLQQALHGKGVASRDVDADLAASWSRSDTWIQSSRFDQLAPASVSAADVHVMISAGFYEVYAELGRAFERATGHRLITTRGPSMGDSPEAIPTRLARGEAADVVILDGGAADDLAKRGLVRAGSTVDLARSQIGMVVRAGATKPNIGSVEAFRRTLLAATSIGYSDSGSGTYLSTTLFKTLGVADQVAGKSRKVRGPPSGEPVAAVVARGEVEIGFQQLSELIHAPGVTFVGALPAELQPGFSFAGAITSAALQPDAALALLRFLASPDADSTLVKAGLTPPIRFAH